MSTGALFIISDSKLKPAWSRNSTLSSAYFCLQQVTVITNSFLDNFAIGKPSISPEVL